ncbi:MAG: UPF0758 domain-containing protein [Rhodospirillales bacterium]
MGAPAPLKRAGPPPAPPSAEEHRARLRHRLITGGPEAVADHELLEMILFLAILRRDTKPIAYRLVQRFGSFANAIAAPMRELLEIEGIGEIRCRRLEDRARGRVAPGPRRNHRPPPCSATGTP